jgi:hypothetical protein
MRAVTTLAADLEPQPRITCLSKLDTEICPYFAAEWGGCNAFSVVVTWAVV